ncbi:hypothetical protein BZA77DRAFT_100592 [Pyronema omphalodes]|nr:hypothetical protein BZA77DRAFT_100592 [Pyronema omphalodes]
MSMQQRGASRDEMHSHVSGRHPTRSTRDTSLAPADSLLWRLGLAFGIIGGGLGIHREAIGDSSVVSVSDRLLLELRGAASHCETLYDEIRPLVRCSAVTRSIRGGIWICYPCTSLRHMAVVRFYLASLEAVECRTSASCSALLAAERASNERKRIPLSSFTVAPFEVPMPCPPQSSLPVLW